MAVSRAQPEQIKSTPNVALLNGFSGHTVTVTKHRAPRGTVGQPVVPTQKMPLADILSLQTSLPLSYGPGFYRFEVVDSGGNGSDVFMQQLGGDVPYDTEAQMAVLPGGPSNGAVPIGADSIHIGNGFIYNTTLKLLTTPWREIVPWEDGQPLPKQPPSATAAAAAGPFANPFHAAATPWTNWSPPGSGWGGFPVNDDSVKVKEMQARFDEEKRQRDLDRLRDEVKAQQATMSAALEKLALAITAKPAGPSETEQMLKRELDEEKRRREQNEREDRLRAEIRAQQERTDATLAAITSAPKTDPMMPMLLQLIASVQANASETVKSIQQATQTGMQASERSTQLMIQQLSASVLSPLQLTQLMQQARGDSAEGARHIVEATRESMALQREVFTNLLEVSQTGDQPAWLQAVRELSGTVVGPIGNMLAQRQQNQQQAQQQPVRRQMPPQQMRQPPAAAMPGAPMAAPPPALPAARASDAAHHARTHVPQTQVEDARSRAAASISHFQAPPTSPGAQGADVTLASASGVVAAPVLGEVVGFPGTPVAPPVASVTPIASAPKKGRNTRKKPAAASPPPPEPPKGFTMDQLRDADPDVLREMIAQLNDEKLFGMTLGYVQQLRESTDPPEKLAESILASRQYITSFGGVIPPGMELLIAQQTVVLVERLLPDVTDEIRAAVVEEIDAALEIENGGEEDDDEEDGEDEEEGDEADAN